MSGFHRAPQDSTSLWQPAKSSTGEGLGSGGSMTAASSWIYSIARAGLLLCSEMDRKLKNDMDGCTEDELPALNFELGQVQGLYNELS